MGKPLCIALFVTAYAAVAAELKLFELTFTGSVEGKVQSTMHFKEIERTPTTSIVEMVYTPARPGLDQVQLIQGACLLMKSRSEHFVQARVISQDPVRIEVTFPREITESPLGSGGPLSEAQCDTFMHRK